MAANENNVILTNILDSLGRIKKQIYTPNKGDISENITLIHSYGIDTDTVRQYLNIPYRYAEAGTYLLMTVIYQNEKLISLHQDLLAQKIEEQYHKMLRKPRKDRPYYPVLPKNDLTSRVFYNAAGDIEKIITPSAPEINVIFLYDYSFAYPYNICTLEFKYSDYDAQGNWQTLTIYGAKGKWQRANCSEELVVKRQIIYKAE